MPATPVQAPTRRYALIGLAPRECALLESLFAMNEEAGASTPALVRVHQPEQADLLIVNGDDRVVAQRLRLAHPRALMVLVGQLPGGHRGMLQGVPILERPLALRSVITVLGALDWPHGLAAARKIVTPLGTGVVHTAHGGAEHDTGPSGPSDAPPAPAPPSGAGAMADAFATTAAPTLPGAASLPARQPWADSQPPEPPAAGDDAPVLLVRKSKAASESTLAAGIRRMGFGVREIHRPQQALAIVAQGAARCVFLDQVSLGDGLWPLARALRQCGRPAEPPPQLVVVARRDTAMEQLRARMAGCLWMRVPLRPETLHALFARCGLQLAERA